MPSTERATDAALTVAPRSQDALQLCLCLVGPRAGLGRFRSWPAGPRNGYGRFVPSEPLRMALNETELRRVTDNSGDSGFRLPLACGGDQR